MAFSNLLLVAVGAFVPCRAIYVCVTCVCVSQIKGMDAAKKELAEIMAKAVEAAKKEGAEGPEAAAATPATPTESAPQDKQAQIAEVQKAISVSRGA